MRRTAAAHVVPVSLGCGAPARAADRGFSIVELVATLTVIGILAVFAVPRMIDRAAFESRGFYDQAQALVRYAQKIAIAQRQSPPKPPIFVVISTDQIRLCYDAPCVTPVADPESGAPFMLPAPTGVTLDPPTTFSYSGSGAPSSGGVITINVYSAGTGDVNRAFSIEPQTGYVH